MDGENSSVDFRHSASGFSPAERHDAPTICPRWHRVFLKATALGLLLLLLTALGVQGWWLVAVSRAQQVPRPSLSLHPSQEVSLGDTVTMRCHLPQPAAWVELYQDGLLRSYKDMDKHQVMAEFSLVCVKLEDAMKYWCQYRVLEPPGVSEKSVPIELVVTDHRYSPPNISISHEKIVEVGTNVTIQCCNQGYGGIIFLHKDGHSAPLQHQDPRGGGTATFTLFGVTPADSGTYRCSYHPKASLFVSSPLGDSVTLEVTPTLAPPGAELVSRGNLVVAVVRGCAAALIFALGVFFVNDARSLWIRRDESNGDVPPHSHTEEPHSGSPPSPVAGEWLKEQGHCEYECYVHYPGYETLKLH